MNHIKYLEDGKTVCDKPQRLGSGFLVVDQNLDTLSCKPCLQLVVAHNEKNERYERREFLDVLVPATEGPSKGVAFFRGFIFALLIEAVAFALIFFVIWLMGGFH